MNVELYKDVIGERAEESPEAEFRRVELAERRALAEKAGMNSQAMMAVQALVREDRERAYPLPGLPLSQEDYAVWAAWLPRQYHSGYVGKSDLDNYAFDAVPASVLSMIADLRPMLSTPAGFDAMEIMTPEGRTSRATVKLRQRDPILVGHRGESAYLLARWGESDERLVPFEAIRLGVTALKTLVWWAETETDPVKALAIVGGLVLGVVAAIIANATTNALVPAIAAGSGTACAIWLLALGDYWLARFRFARAGGVW